MDISYYLLTTIPLSPTSYMRSHDKHQLVVSIALY